MSRDFVMGDKQIGDRYGGDHVRGDRTVYNGGYEPRSSADPQAAAARRVVLLLSANPKSTPGLRLDEERRAIDRAIALAQGNARFEVRSAEAVRITDLPTALLRYQPAIVHFSGHGSGPEGIVVTDEYGRPQAVPPRALTGLFRILGGSLRCVVLNACFTLDQARAIAEHVPCVLGMSGRVSDAAAIQFASGFYEGLAFGRSVRQAYELGRSMVELDEHTDAEMPTLVAGPGVAEALVIAD